MSNFLTNNEIRVIKAMLKLDPKLTKQAIHSYFSRPGRDINQARITDIENGRLGKDLPPATPKEALAYMHRYSNACRLTNTFPPPTAMQNSKVGLAQLSLCLNCWPVGQGLFLSGLISSSKGGSFSWVYDCGSISKPTSKGPVLPRALKDFRNQHNGNCIDMVTLSHFDEDHVNGITDLIKGTKIKALVLPYVDLLQRLFIAFDEQIATDDPLFEFFVNPTAYLSERADIDQIVFVPPVGPDDIAPETPEVPGPEGPIDGARFEVRDPIEGDVDDPTLIDQKSSYVRQLRKGGKIVIPSYWEFLPYNDASRFPDVSNHFRTSVVQVVNSILANPKNCSAELKHLKDIYDRNFGNSGRRRNIISLFLYSGSISKNLRIQRHISTHQVRWNGAYTNFGQLFTGDGYLKTQTQLAALTRYLSADRRLERAGVVQVMHHGALGNWHPGVAKALSPAVSIFSSDPNRAPTYHPNSEVLRDFWPYCPVQVDKDTGFHLHLDLA
ncbi:hypothetical protein [uncultured Cohaesibacter sp.]|uniref:hypothetical protein n=1 Tax=uncultured Cohaesibacter sp. TaxID=1002546 RepID=UPI002AA6BAEF|nr:hypothetical protein [uncultured Cohaesibacter sp.]